MNRNTRSEFREAMVWIAIGLVVIVVAVGVYFAFAVLRKQSADFRGDVAATERVKADGAYRIAAYDEFFNRCAGIQGKEATLAALKAELKTNPPADRISQIQASITAITGSRAADIAQYNANAAKTATSGQFMSSNLPYQLDPNQEKTTCAVR